MSSTSFTARWIAPVAGRPIENGRIRVEGGYIAAVERSRGPERAATDFADAVVVPGFVNAHAHLDLSCLRGRVPAGNSFKDWLVGLMRQNPRFGPEGVLRESVRAGVRESIAAGVTCLADIGAGAVAVHEWRQAPMHVVGFLEVFGMGSRRIAGRDEALALCAASGDAIAPVSKDAPFIRRLGLSPHAPYSADAPVFGEAIAFCRRAGRPISTHLAETHEELQFLRDGTGPLRELLESLGLWDGSFSPPGCSPVEYAARLGLLACRPVLAHVNYVSEQDLRLLAGSAASVAYCPRSHAFFGHAPHAYRQMLAAGVNVCIGTDSLASNASLSILDDLRFLRECDDGTPDAQLLEMGTLAGARALGEDAEVGSLEAGKRADFVVIPLERGCEPLEDVLRGQAAPSAVILGGAPIKPGR